MLLSIKAFVFGVYFALIQIAYFFLLEVLLSSRAAPFFVSLFFWLVGFVCGLSIKRTRLLGLFIFLSVGTYYLALFLISRAPFQDILLPFIGSCVGVSGAAAGYFFISRGGQFADAKSLFFHENNGFLMGIAISWALAIFAGRFYLLFGPGVGAIALLAIENFGFDDHEA